MAEAFGIAVAENAVGTVAGNWIKRILKLISNPIILVFKWNANVENLKKKVAELKEEVQNVEHYSQAVERRGEEIEQKLKTWLKSTDKFIEAADTIDDDEAKAKKKCVSGLCLNLLSRYKLSKQAVEDSKYIAGLVQKAHGFNLPLSYPPISQPEVAAAVKGFQEFDSRIGVLDKIVESLQSPSINVIGVHGMPGVGKTMLLKEVKRKTEQEKLFDAVVMASVTKNPVLKEIQNEIAYGLGLELPVGIGDRSIVDRVRARFLKETKVLVILDDIWDKLDLEALGIPFKDQQKLNAETRSSSAEDQRTKCKILLSSRELNVLSTKMGTQKEVAVGQLEHQEAWQMFKKIVGDRAESSELQPTGIEIIKKCGGLPVAITALAEALKDKNSYEWRSALQKLRHPSPSNFTGIYAGVYTAIEVSYNHLGREELKKIFLLSSLMGRNALIQDLLKYGVGLGLFSQANTIEEARDEVLTLISNLKAASLLIDGSDNEHFGMHDVIRDVAVSIACRDRHGLLLTDENVPKEWSDREAMNDFKWICLRYANVNELPDELESSQLTFFCWFNKDPSLNIPANFFKGMQRLQVLDLTHMHLSSLPSSICFLKNLHTLCLDQSLLRDIRIIGELKNLEILSLMSSDFEELPKEIGQLTKLKLLDLSDCAKLKVILPCVLASMSRLEELYLGNSFDLWEHEEYKNQGNASLAELKHLKRLTALEVRILDVQMIPTDLFSEKLTRYKIFFGDTWNNWTSCFQSSRILKLQLKASISFDYTVKRLLKMTEELHLEELNGVKNVVDEFDSEGFKDLKYLYVRNAPEVQQIINSEEGVLFNAFPILEILFLHNLIKLEKIFQGWFKETAFNKLRGITVECCHELKNLFSFSVAKQLLQLQYITVGDCSNMEEIIDNEEQGSGNAIVEATDGVKQKFGEQLRSLRLRYLANLTYFNNSCRRMTLFNEQVVFPKLEELELSWINVNMIWHASTTSSSIGNLTKLIIQDCHNLEYLFSFSMIQCLVKLGHLEIKECKRMREIIVTDNLEEKEKINFPQLNFLLMKDLQNLVRFHSRNCIVEFPSLKQLDIKNCPEFKGFTIKSTSTDVAIDIQPLFNEQVAFLSLERITITHLKNLTTVWQDQLHVDSFCKLKSLEVQFCEKLITVMPYDNMLGNLWRSLEELTIVGCSSLEVVFRIGESNAAGTPVPIDTQLRVLDIRDLPRLKHVWDKDPKGILTFHNLESVLVNYCQSLNNLFPTSVAKDLSQLKKLELCNSGLEEIVAMGGGGIEAVVKFEFPQLSRLVLWNLTRFRYFYPGKHRTEWPMLKKLKFSSCGKIKKRNGQEGQLDFPVQQPLFCMEKVIPQLDELSLTKDDIAMMCSEHQSKKDLFFNIKFLQIQNFFDDETDVLPICFLHRFSNLEKLALMDCRLTELFPSKEDHVEEQDKYPEMLSKIRELHLVDINNLRHIFSHDSSSILQNLQILQVWRCDSLTGLSTSKTASFQNLINLYVQGCHTSLKTLVLVSTAQSLVQLECMTVSECNSLTEIVGSEGDGMEDSVINFSQLRFLKFECLPRLESFCSRNFILKFPSLEKVIVDQCPKLKIFSEGDLNTPVLGGVELVEGEDKWFWAGDLNTTIQRMYKEKVGYASLKNLKLSDFPELMEIWHIKRPQEISLDWRLLLHLQIYDCSNFTYLLTPSMVRCLVQLKTIEVKNCAMMEQVIRGDGEENKMIFPQLRVITLRSCSNLTTFYVGSYSLEFPALIDIMVEDCPKMVTFTSTSSREHEKEASQYFFTSEVEIPTLEELTLSSINIQEIWHGQLTSASSFPQNLRELIVTDCDNLRYLFTSSSLMVKIFAKLKVLKICKCEVMHVIILIKGIKEEEEEEEEERICQTMFPELETLVLESLPRLTRFYSNGDSLQGEISESLGLNDGRSQPLSVMESTSGQIEACKLVFPQVRYLELYDLQKFKSFFYRKHVTEWPTLKSMHVYGCDEVQIFASEFSSIKITHEDNQLESQTQHPLFWISKDTFPSLEELKLEWNDNMKEVWHGQQPEEYLAKLKVVELTCFPERSAFLPPFFFQSLPNLEKLVVRDAFFNEVFQCEEVGVKEKPSKCGRTPLCELRLSKLYQLTHLWKEESPIEPIFSNLKTLEVQDCNKLKNLVPSTIYFNNLQTLEVSSCHRLVNLMRYSTAESLVQLTRMSVHDCDLIMEIVASIDDELKDGIIFSRLKYLQLCGLPRLASFCSMKCNFEFPSLEEVIVEKCPRMKTFSMGEVRTSLLERVQFTKDNDTWRWEGNLNTTIQKLFTKKVVYCGLENLYMNSDRNPLVITWSNNPQEILDFEKLKCLELINCSSLKYLLNSSMVSSLVQLEDLKVKCCSAMEQVIMVKEVEEGAETELIFPSLNSILLGSCSNLTSFCATTYPLKFPSLIEIAIDDCPNMATFASTFSREQEKETIDGESEESNEKEEPDIPIEPFLSDKVHFFVLESLKLTYVGIQMVWHSQVPGMSRFVENLTELTVEGCCNLKYLMTFSMFKSLVHLQTLQILECEMLEAVILLEELEKEEIIFPKLERLELFDLPKLKRFCSYSDSVEEIYESQGVNGSGSQTTPSTLVETIDTMLVFPQVTYLKLFCLPTFWSLCPQKHAAEWSPLKYVQATFPCLEELELEWNDIMNEIWHGQHPEEYFCKLRALKLLGFPAFLRPFFFQSLPNLQKLVLSDSFFSEIFQCEEVGAEEKPVCGQTLLRELRLSKLHELTHLWKEESQLEPVFNNLRTLVVHECGKLMNLVPSTVYFENLQTLKVSQCHGLVNLVRYSTAKSLVQLTSLQVINCEMIEEIVGCSGDDVKDGIVFNKLEYLRFKGLPRLASFCSGSCNFIFPSLEDVIVTKCSKMQNFSLGEVITTKLQKVKLTPYDDEDEGRWEGNLNHTMQQLFTEKGASDSEDDFEEDYFEDDSDEYYSEDEYSEEESN